ncbi:MAG: chromosome segregation protein SMC, partial [Gammaproteobacteria bacterium]|nr:chromosome segregation protein SMC [Gammaproteobacteria bacterium]
YLNGTKCRRRDIMDLFLGTGLGPRSYAIIEQGMISRFVEAKPDDLRVLIEEAAGISKYKERRRETETRIRRARENLDRINDLREELDKQLRRLERQSRIATRYRQLKEEERLMQAQLLALRWQEYDQKATEHQQKVRQAELAVQERLASQRSIEAEIEKERESHHQSNEAFNEVQGRFYAIGADIAGSEQKLKGIRERRAMVERDLNKAEQLWHETHGVMKTDQQRVVELEQSLLRDEPRQLELQQEDATLTAIWEKAEEAWHTWQSELESFNRSAGDPQRNAEIARSRIEQLERQQSNSVRQQGRLQEELQRLPKVDQHELEQMSAVLNQLETSLHLQREEGQSLRHSITRQREENRQLADTLNGERGALQQLRGRLTSLEALQQDALGRDKRGVQQWLAECGVADAPRLAEQVTVDQGWERAVETVLSGYLEAVAVEDDQPLLEQADLLNRGEVRFIQSAKRGAEESSEPLLEHAVALSRVVKSDRAVADRLYGIYGVDTLSDALQLRSQLTPGTSLVTREGIWLGAEWSQVVREDDHEAGVLQREQTIRELKQQCALLEVAVTRLEEQRTQGREQLKGREQQFESLQRTADQQASRLSTQKAELSGKQARQEQANQRKDRIEEEQLRAKEEIAQAEEEIRALRGGLETALLAMADNEAARSQMESRRGVLREAMDRSRDQSREKRDQLHRLTVQVESARTRLESTRNGLTRMEAQLALSESRKHELVASRDALDAPLVELQQTLEEHLARQLVVDNELTNARRRLEQIEQQLRELDGQRMVAEKEVQELRSVHEKLQLEGQEIVVRRQTVDEQLQEGGQQRDHLLREMPEGATVVQWQQDVDEMARKIQKLGPINLAAIEEYQTESERKSYLDQQNGDLVEALETLEAAIAKIDRETRSRFKETFEKINDGIKGNFPRLFGGGRAHLEMTGDDLLDTGVTIMAQPPGKRNSTIHLLSGGEKALTAVALVFSIFDLNPAPFCMLDEVDAPLDEANVGRFCNMVKQMSERVQFIFITHNKATMEISDQLSGVTMHEPGVSRIVAVDIEEAQAMAVS